MCGTHPEICSQAFYRPCCTTSKCYLELLRNICGMFMKEDFWCPSQTLCKWIFLGQFLYLCWKAQKYFSLGSNFDLALTSPSSDVTLLTYSWIMFAIKVRIFFACKICALLGSRSAAGFIPATYSELSFMSRGPYSLPLKKQDCVHKTQVYDFPSLEQSWTWLSETSPGLLLHSFHYPK